jgi:hypothetical protein
MKETCGKQPGKKVNSAEMQKACKILSIKDSSSGVAHLSILVVKTNSHNYLFQINLEDFSQINLCWSEEAMRFFLSKEAMSILHSREAMVFLFSLCILSASLMTFVVMHIPASIHQAQMFNIQLLVGGKDNQRH